MEFKTEEKNIDHICPTCGKRMSKIVPTKRNLDTNDFLSKATEVFLCFNYSCSAKMNFHKDRWWTWAKK